MNRVFFLIAGDKVGLALRCSLLLMAMLNSGSLY